MRKAIHKARIRRQPAVVVIDRPRLAPGAAYRDLMALVERCVRADLKRETIAGSSVLSARSARQGS